MENMAMNWYAQKSVYVIAAATIIYFIIEFV